MIFNITEIAKDCAKIIVNITEIAKDCTKIIFNITEIAKDYPRLILGQYIVSEQLTVVTSRAIRVTCNISRDGTAT